MEDKFISISVLNDKTFKIEDYQRGYKWGEKEITSLLNDIKNHKSEQGKYCLQPIIVKPIVDQDNQFEIIDGQQRITSIYLLNIFLGDIVTELNYGIEYKTREISQELLKNKDKVRNFINYNSWEEFKLENQTYDNSDIYHFFRVYESINNWFAIENQITKEDFFRKMLQDLFIIWYDVTKGELQVNESTKAETVFVNFNSNKLDLVNSELIKALFVLDHDQVNSKELQKHIANELSLEWDNIENKLQDNSFWYFLNNNKNYTENATRINFLFDIIADVKEKEQNTLASYYYYENIIKTSTSKKKEWDKVKNLFYKLEEWYEDKEAFHLVGFLIAANFKKLKEIINESKSKTKEKFKNHLKEIIIKKFHEKTDDNYNYNLNKLNYKEDYEKCKNILLLLNIQEFLVDNSSNRFPFNLYYDTNWSIEHINPQNPREFNSKEMLNSWLNSLKPFDKNADSLSEANGLQKCISIIEENLNQDLKAIRKLKEFDEILEKLEIHKIGNLALLDKNTNSALGNKPFLEKRNDILKFDQDGMNDMKEKVYIPKSTRDVFLKTSTSIKFNESGNFFTMADCEKYQEFIQERLYKYLPNHEKLKH